MSFMTLRNVLLLLWQHCLRFLNRNLNVAYSTHRTSKITVMPSTAFENVTFRAHDCIIMALLAPQLVEELPNLVDDLSGSIRFYHIYQLNCHSLILLSEYIVVSFCFSLHVTSAISCICGCIVWQMLTPE